MRVEPVGNCVLRSFPRDPRTAIFRFDTLGDEQLWTGVLRMHDVIATVDPATAPPVGLKIDVEALPPRSSPRFAAGESKWPTPPSRSNSSASTQLSA